MSIIDLLWIFLILSSLQPVIRQRWLEAQRLRAFRQLEASRKSRVIGLIHRQETMSFLGFPVARYIDIEDSERLLRAIQLTVRNATTALEQAMQRAAAEAERGEPVGAASGGRRGGRDRDGGDGGSGETVEGEYREV